MSRSVWVHSSDYLHSATQRPPTHYPTEMSMLAIPRAGGGHCPYNVHLPATVQGPARLSLPLSRPHISACLLQELIQKHHELLMRGMQGTATRTKAFTGSELFSLGNEFYSEMQRPDVLAGAVVLKIFLFFHSNSCSNYIIQVK